MLIRQSRPPFLNTGSIFHDLKQLGAVRFVQVIDAPTLEILAEGHHESLPSGIGDQGLSRVWS